MKVAVLGSGLMGSVISWDLAKSPEVDSVVVADLDAERLSALKRKAPGNKLTVETLDLRNRERTVGFLKEADVVASALPHGVVHAADLAGVEAGAKVVNIAFEDSQMDLDVAARKTGALLVPGCGLAPGLGGILLAQGVRDLAGADEGHILVGGIPQKPRPPFGYRLVFSIVGLLREYTDDARVFREGKLVRVRPFSTVERVDFPEPVGTLEAFCTDGLSSLVYTMKAMKVLDEKTLRWPGHAEKMSLLLDSGYFSTQKVRAGGAEVSPLEVSWAVLGHELGKGDPEDMTVMRVEAMSKDAEVAYEMLDRYDHASGTTSMGRTTGYTASIVTQMVGAGKIEGPGVVPPETAVRGERVGELIAELDRRGVKISRTERKRE